MAFSEKIKKEVRRKAGFKCCICHAAWPDVHHIISQEDKGSNDIDNAAPLCGTCHKNFGDNPQRRKNIKEARDWWYERVRSMYKSNVGEDIKPILDKISQRVDLIKLNQDIHGKAVTDLKESLRSYIDKVIDISGTPQAISDTVSGVVSGTIMITSRKCDSCGKLSSGGQGGKCPFCGFPMI